MALSAGVLGPMYTMAGKARGGLDGDFVQPPPAHLECPVCLLVLKDPHVSSCCGNHFCRLCIQRVEQDGKPCPLCQDSDFSSMLHKGVKREVNALKVRCPKRELGCQWEGDLGMLEEHVAAGPRARSGGCGYVEVECMYGCGRAFQRRSIQEHEGEACPYRPIEVQMSSNLKKVKDVLADNEMLKQEVAELKGRLSVVLDESKALKFRVAQLEQNQQYTPPSVSASELEALKREVRELKSAQNTRFDQELKSFKQALMQEIIQLMLGAKQAVLPTKPVDPLNAKLLKDLKDKGILRSERVEKTMQAIDRKHYAPTNVYQDSPQSIGHNTTISAPHMHAHTLELLSEVLCRGAAVLDIGSGSGYLTACMAYMTAPGGYAVGIDRVQELTHQATVNVTKDNPELLQNKWLYFVTGDGRNGHMALAPYDVIHVGGAIPIVPQVLYDQLKCGGRMIVPVGPQGGDQYLEQHDKRMNGTITRKRLFGVRYGPLI